MGYSISFHLICILMCFFNKIIIIVIIINKLIIIVIIVRIITQRVIIRTLRKGTYIKERISCERTLESAYLLTKVKKGKSKELLSCSEDEQPKCMNIFQFRDQVTMKVTPE